MESANSRAAARRASERFHAAHIVALCPAMADERLVRSLLRRYAVDESRAVCMCRAAAAREVANEDVPALPVCARWAEMCAHLQLHTNPDVADVLGRTKRPTVAFAGRVCRSEARVGPAGALDFENESFPSVYSTFSLADTLRQKQLVVRADEETDSMDTFALQQDHSRCWPPRVLYDGSLRDDLLTALRVAHRFIGDTREERNLSGGGVVGRRAEVARVHAKVGETALGGDLGAASRAWLSAGFETHCSNVGAFARVRWRMKHTAVAARYANAGEVADWIEELLAACVA